MATQADNVKLISMTDGGDGSTFFSVEFEDGSSIGQNPDLPYDGHVEYIRKEDGSFEEKIVWDKT